MSTDCLSLPDGARPATASVPTSVSDVVMVASVDR